MIQNITERLTQRQKRLEQYYGPKFPTTKARLRAQWHFLWRDHAILRLLWANRAQIAPGVWRSNHPSPARIKKYKNMGIGTILNLRGVNKKSPYLFEKAACKAVGMKLIDVSTNAHNLAPSATYLGLLDLFETLEKPFLMHCKSGADRAGLVSALYLMHMEGVPVAEAKKQLSIRYIHIRSLKTGILDHMLDAYQADTAEKNIPIRDWLTSHYDRDELTQEFETARGIPSRND